MSKLDIFHHIVHVQVLAWMIALKMLPRGPSWATSGEDFFFFFSILLFSLSFLLSARAFIFRALLWLIGSPTFMILLVEYILYRNIKFKFHLIILSKSVLAFNFQINPSGLVQLFAE